MLFFWGGGGVGNLFTIYVNIIILAFHYCHSGCDADKAELTWV